MDSKYSATDVWRKMKTRTFSHARPTKTQINEKKKKNKKNKKKKNKKKKKKKNETRPATILIRHQENIPI